LAGLVDLAALRSALQRMLPEHMVPSGYVGLSGLPLTASGKLDRRALPEVEVTVRQEAYVAPRSETEALLCQIMRDVAAHDGLDLAQVGIDDHFFDIGGHSILAAHYAARLEQALGRPVPVRLIFEAPRVRELASQLAADEGEHWPLIRFESESPTPPRSGQALPVLYCIHPAGGQATRYQRIVAPLSGVAQVIGVQAPGLAANEAAFENYQEMVETYCAAIAEATPTVPIFLLGWSFGGYVAQDVACRLITRGHSVAGLVILDCVDGPSEVPLKEDPGACEEERDFERWLLQLVRAFHPESEAAFRVASSREDGLRIVKDAAVASGEFDATEVSDDPVWLERSSQVWYRHEALLKERPASGRFPGRTLLVRASDTRERVADPTFGWSTACGEIETFDVPFAHSDLLNAEAAIMIARAVRRWLPA